MTKGSRGLRQRSPGTWTITVYTGRHDQSGRYQRVTETLRGTKRQAEQRRSQLLADLSSGRYQKPSRETVASFLLRWLATKGDLKEGSLLRYKHAINKQIIPLIGKQLLSNLDTADILAVHSAWKSSGYANATIIGHHNVLHQSMKDAVRWRLIPRNPVDDVNPPSSHHKERPVLDIHDLTRLITVLDSSPLAVAFRLLIHTGMRVGEVLGLRWKDVNLDDAYMLITQNRTLRATYESTKTHRSTRKIDLDQTIVRLLRVHKANQAAARRWSSVAWPDHDLICCWSESGKESRVTGRFHYAGQNWAHSAVYYHFKKAIRQLELNPDLRPHDIRHTHASILLDQGADIKVVQERLGHSSPSITLTIYHHLLPGRQKKASDQFAASLESETPKTESDAI